MATNTRSALTRKPAFESFDDAFENLFRGFFLHPVGFDSTGKDAQFRIDVVEKDNEYRLHAELPGVRKEDIDVTVDGDEVAISAQSRNEHEERNEAGRVVRSERHYGTLYRSFSLGQEVDLAKAEAKYVDGVLELTLPKLPGASATRKRLEIH